MLKLAPLLEKSHLKAGILAVPLPKVPRKSLVGDTVALKIRSAVLSLKRDCSCGNITCVLSAIELAKEVFLPGVEVDYIVQLIHDLNWVFLTSSA